MTNFKTIPVKMIAYNLELPKTIYVNFEGLDVHILTFLKKQYTF
jgi:hypothetical protein